MDLEKIRELLKIVAESGLAEVEMEIGDDQIKLVARQNASTPPLAAPAKDGVAVMSPAPVAVEAVSETTPTEPETPPPPTAEEAFIKAELIGRFYRAPAPDADPFVNVGDTVKPGDVLCIIESMKVMNEIVSDVAGTIKQILVENDEGVEFDQPLFVINPA